MSTTPWRIAPWRSAPRYARRWATSWALRATGSCWPWTRRRRRSRWISRAGPTSCGRSRFERERVGELPTELVPHFFRSLAEALGAALHITVRGENSHHMIESCFKGVGRSLRQAIRLEGRELPSTKGTL